MLAVGSPILVLLQAGIEHTSIGKINEQDKCDDCDDTACNTFDDGQPPSPCTFLLAFTDSVPCMMNIHRHPLRPASPCIC